MILKNLDSIYPSLYDLFNQNFIKTGDRNYAKISLGYSKTHTYYVNDNFKCVVLLDSNEIENQDPPFLNRFEKHIVSFDFLLSGKKDYIKKSQEYSKIINDLIISSDPNQPLKVDLSKQLLNCDLDEIQGIIYQLIDEYKDRNNNIFDYILEKISPTFSQDIIAFAKNSNFQNKNQGIFNKIITYYEKYEHNKLISYLEKINTPKHIIYTFSNIIENIFGGRNDEIAINTIYSEFNYEKSSEILVQDYYSEREIEDEIRKYYEDNTKNLCILSFENIDCVHLNHINFLICNYENQKNISIENQKVILFTIHIKRYLTKCIYDSKDIIPNHYLISHLYDYPQIFIDNLSGNKIDFKTVLNSSTNDLLNLHEMIDTEKEFKEGLYNAYSKIRYSIYNVDNNFKIENYIEESCKFLLNNETYKNIIIEKIKSEINKSN